jgi:hypothetical protein
MEMDPDSAVFQRIFMNPFAYTAFKSTEPWLQVRRPPCSAPARSVPAARPRAAPATPPSCALAMQEYIALDMPAAMREAGFRAPLTQPNTPRHKTVVAVKP